jgi:hypothetical protein
MEITVIPEILINTKPPNMRLQVTSQLAAKNHASSLDSLVSPPQKYAIIEVTVAAASLGAPEALAVRRLQ